MSPNIYMGSVLSQQTAARVASVQPEGKLRVKTSKRQSVAAQRGLFQQQYGGHGRVIAEKLQKSVFVCHRPRLQNTQKYSPGFQVTFASFGMFLLVVLQENLRKKSEEKQISRSAPVLSSLPLYYTRKDCFHLNRLNFLR